MSRGRMIDREFYRNEDVNDLPRDARYLYTSMIVNADDRGRMRASPKYLKGLTWPYDDDISVDMVTDWRSLIAGRGLIAIYEVEGVEYLSHPNWEKWQILRKDRIKPSDCPPPTTKRQPDVNHVVDPAPPKRSEVKRSEEKLITKRFIKPSFMEVTEYARTIGFDLDGCQFVDHYEARGWKYKAGQPMVDWRAAVRTWKKNQFSNGVQGPAAQSKVYWVWKVLRATNKVIEKLQFPTVTEANAKCDRLKDELDPDIYSVEVR